MRADESDIDDARVVVDLDDQPVAVAFDVEHHAVVRQDVGAAIANEDVPRRFPLGAGCFGVPCFERFLCKLITPYRQNSRLM